MISTGSVVQLLTGGPKMTVQHVNGSVVTTQWFEGTELKSQQFQLNTLKEAQLTEQILFE